MRPKVRGRVEPCSPSRTERSLNTTSPRSPISQSRPPLPLLPGEPLSSPASVKTETRCTSESREMLASVSLLPDDGGPTSQVQTGSPGSRFAATVPSTISTMARSGIQSCSQKAAITSGSEVMSWPSPARAMRQSGHTSGTRPMKIDPQVGQLGSPTKARDVSPLTTGMPEPFDEDGGDAARLPRASGRRRRAGMPTSAAVGNVAA